MAKLVGLSPERFICGHTLTEKPSNLNLACDFLD